MELPPSGKSQQIQPDPADQRGTWSSLSYDHDPGATVRRCTMSNRPKTGDPLLDEVDEARRRILEECGGDPRKALESYPEYQKQFGDRLVNYQDMERPG